MVRSIDRAASRRGPGEFIIIFFGRTLDFSQTTGSKVKLCAFNPLLTALKVTDDRGRATHFNFSFSMFDA